MKNGRNTTISDSFSYGIVMVIANIAGTIGLFIFMMILRALCGDSVVFSVQVHGWLLCSLLDLIISAVAMVVTALVTRFYFSYKIPDILPRNNDNALEQQSIWRNFAFMVLPAEIIRMVAASTCTVPGQMFGYRLFNGFFTIVPNFLFDQFYLTPTGRLSQIRETGYTMGENILFVGIYLIYFACTIGVLYLVFSRVWKKCVDVRNSEVKLRMDPEQIK
jgi:hypothetical protein